MFSNAPTPYPELNEVLQELTTSVQEVLGGNFHSACLQGSFAMGDFDRDSDVDFLVIVNDEISAHAVESLQRMHGRLFDLDSPWAKHLEGSYIPKHLLRDYSRSGSELWYLDNGSRLLVSSNHCNTAVVRWTIW